MNEYEKVCAYLKIVYCNLFSLHHNLVGGNWYGDHERLGKYYAEIGEILDELVERGLSLGYKEPSISEAVLAFSGDVLPCMDRGKEESFGYVMEAFRSAAGLMKAAEAIVPPDVTNELQEWEYDLNFEADYKIARTLGKTTGGHRSAQYEEDD